MDDFNGTNLNGDAVDAVVETVAPPSTSKLRSMFMKFANNCAEHRADAFRDRRYYDGDQISTKWKKSLEDNDLPEVPINLIKDNIDAHIGLISSQKTEVRAFSRNSAGAPAAETCTKLIRYAIDSAQIERLIREASSFLFVESIGALLIECDNENIYAKIIDYRDLFYDPSSRRSDFSDARYIGFSSWLPISDVKAGYPEAFARISPSGDYSDFLDMEKGEGWDKDVEDDASPWTRGKDTIRVIETYYLDDGQWMNAVWCHRGVLDHGPSQYTTDKGVSRHPIAAMSCNVMLSPDAKNQRYGEVRKLIYPQDDYNSRRSVALKHMMSKVIQMTEPGAQPVDAETLRAEASKRTIIMPPGYAVQDISVSAEQVQFMQISGEEIQRLSPASAVTGANLPDDASGRSRQLAAAGGRLSLTPILERVQDWRDNIYRHAWYCINQYWHSEMEVRITGDVNATKYLRINVPKVEETQEPILDPTGQPLIDPYSGQPVMQTVAKVVGVENDVATMDMDFNLKTVESHNSLEQEVWDSMMKMASSLQLGFGTPEFRLAMEWYELPNRTEVIERYDAMVEKLKTENAEGQQMQQQMQEMQTQLKMLLDKNKAERDASSAQVNMAKAERTHIENAILSDNHNQEQELQAIMAQQLFR